jgi:hypothetical protein
LEAAGFKFNPYDPCVANQLKKGPQHALLFHVNDLKSSHIDPRVNDDLNKWLKENFGEHGEETIYRGKIHDYLGMQLDYSVKGKVKVGMIDYVIEMLKHFPQTLKENKTATMPASDTLFNEGQGRKLHQECADIYHTMVAKALFLCKRARPDIQQTIAVLCTRVKEPNV